MADTEAHIPNVYEEVIHLLLFSSSLELIHMILHSALLLTWMRKYVVMCVLTYPRRVHEDS